MAVRMAKLERTSSGTWKSRKVIPADVRDAYGKREEKPTWPATLTSSEARAAFGEWLGRVEQRIADLRQLQKAGSVTLSEKQVRALAGRWYHSLVAEYGDNPGDALGWEMAQEAVQPDDDEESWRRYMAGDERPDVRPLKPTKQIIEERDRLLEKERLKVDPGTAERLLRDMLDLYWRFCDLMIRRAHGDYGDDPAAATLPDWSDSVARPEPATVKSKVALLSLFDGYVREREPAPSTIKAWKRQLNRFIEHLGHDDALRVTRADVVAWKDKLIGTPGRNGRPKSAKTIQDTYLAGLRTVLGWGVDNGCIPSNPAEGVKVAARKAMKLRDKGFTDAEAVTILRATLEPSKERLSEERARAQRWVPWLCAYSGARVNEITQMRGIDVYKDDAGIWVFRITPEAGSVKTGEARVVPIHSHVIEQGFVEEARKWGEGPLFYDPKRHRGGSAGNPQYKKVGEFLARWVRSLGIDDPNVAPNHGWRHRFKTVAREAKLDEEARDFLAGHRPRTEGAKYGVWTPRALKPEIEKLPRYTIN